MNGGYPIGGVNRDQDFLVVVSGLHDNVSCSQSPAFPKGKMASIVAKAFYEELHTQLDGNTVAHFKLADFALNPECDGGEWRPRQGLDGRSVKLYGYDHFAERVRQAQGTGQNVVAIDFVSPGQANNNLRAYGGLGLHFMVGTTQTDLTVAEQIAVDNNLVGMVAPNYDIWIVSDVNRIKRMAKEMPGHYKGWGLVFLESHQPSKKDPSGTGDGLCYAVSVLLGRDIKPRGVNPDLENPGQISDLLHNEDTQDAMISVRRPDIQTTVLGVPQEWVPWHAYHHLAFVHPSGMVNVGLSTKRHGGASYQAGLVASLPYFASKIIQGKSGLYTVERMLESMVK